MQGSVHCTLQQVCNRMAYCFKVTSSWPYHPPSETNIVPIETHQIHFSWTLATKLSQMFVLNSVFVKSDYRSENNTLLFYIFSTVHLDNWKCSSWKDKSKGIYFLQIYQPNLPFCITSWLKLMSSSHYFHWTAGNVNSVALCLIRKADLTFHVH